MGCWKIYHIGSSSILLFRKKITKRTSTTSLKLVIIIKQTRSLEIFKIFPFTMDRPQLAMNVNLRHCHDVFTSSRQHADCTRTTTDCTYRTAGPPLNANVVHSQSASSYIYIHIAIGIVYTHIHIHCHNIRNRVGLTFVHSSSRRD